jgi:hypothetical protein
MPASTLPTRSAPTSAALVKMPPPRRAKIEISEAPKASATSAVDHGAVIAANGMACGPVRYQKKHRNREQREACHEHAGDGASAERQGQAFLQPDLRGGRGADVRAHRDVHPDEPGDARQHGAEQEADRRIWTEEIGDQHGHDTPTMAMVRYCRPDRLARLPGWPQRFPASFHCRPVR